MTFLQTTKDGTLVWFLIISQIFLGMLFWNLKVKRNSVSFYLYCSFHFFSLQFHGIFYPHLLLRLPFRIIIIILKYYHYRNYHIEIILYKNHNITLIIVIIIRIIIVLESLL